METRITNFKVSNRIGRWSFVLFLAGLAAIVLGIIVALGGGFDTCAALVGGGLLTMALSAAMDGFAIIVRKALNDLVEDGDDKYLLYVKKDDDVTM